MAVPITASADSWIKLTNMDCQVWSSEPDTSKDTATWAGECADGKATGPGRLEWFVDKKLWGHYEGEMAEGKLDGRGVLHIKAVSEGFDVIEGSFADGEPVGIVDFKGGNGHRFKGEVKSGVPDGYGTYEDAEGNVFDGYFVAGEPQSGYALSASGEEYLGEFQDGERHGGGC